MKRQSVKISCVTTKTNTSVNESFDVFGFINPTYDIVDYINS